MPMYHVCRRCNAPRSPKIHKINQAVDLVAKYHSDHRLIYFVSLVTDENSHPIFYMDLTDAADGTV